MGLREALDQFLSTDGEEEEPIDEGRSGRDQTDDAPGRTIIYECRNCGTAVAPETEECPSCGDDGIATYAIE